MATFSVPQRRNESSLFARLRDIDLLPYGLTAPTLLIILLVGIYPIIQAFWVSFQSNPLAATGSNFVFLENYGKVFQNPEFWGAFGVTFLFSIVSVALESFLGLLIALMLNRNFPGRGLMRAAMLVPWAFPTIVSAKIWQLMFNDQLGIISYNLQSLGLLKPGDTLLRTTGGIITATIMTDVWKTTPFMALLLLAGLQVIPADVYESASVDGATKWQSFFKITLPLLRNTFLVALLFRILDAVRVFDLFYVLAGRQVKTLSSLAYNYMFAGTSLDFPVGVASAVILFGIAMIIGLLFMAGGLKNIIQQG